MTAEQLLHSLIEQGVLCAVEGDKLRIDAPRGTVSSGVLADLVKHKADLIKMLTDGADSHADREWARFKNAAVQLPDGEGWTDPTAWPNGRPDWLEGVMRAEASTPALDHDRDDRARQAAPPGWRPGRWARRLRALAGACEALHPARAADLRGQADSVGDDDRGRQSNGLVAGANRHLRLNGLRDSGEIEQNVDELMFLHRDKLSVEVCTGRPAETRQGLRQRQERG